MNETEKIYRCTDKLEEICRLLYLKLDERARPEDAERAVTLLEEATPMVAEIYEIRSDCSSPRTQDP